MERTTLPLSPPDPTLRLRRLAHPVTALGPGRRLALWVTGCRRRCPGCISPELQDPAAGRALPVSRVLERIVRIEGLDGITLTGGEPVEQAVALDRLLAGLVRERPHWDVLLYTGDTPAALKRRGPAVQRLLARCDLLVAGPYRSEVPARHPLAGSGNQRVLALTARGGALLCRCAAGSPPPANLGTGRNGRDLLIGILSPAARARLHRALGLAPEEMAHG